MMQLIALRPLTYGTRRMRPGEVFTAQDSHARLLVAIGRARRGDTVPGADVSGPQEQQREPALAAVLSPEIEGKPRRARRAYKRRDMRAED